VTDDDTYRFDPAEFREDGETDEPGTPDGATSSVGPDAPDGQVGSGGGDSDDDPETDREFGWQGWVLVGMLFVAFVVVPVLLYFVPRAQWLAGSLGLGYRDAFLVLPLVPALALGALAVWATTRP
jgi:hypothetical protein